VVSFNAIMKMQLQELQVIEQHLQAAANPPAISPVRKSDNDTPF
jgi:hypothetical protein